MTLLSINKDYRQHRLFSQSIQTTEESLITLGIFQHHDLYK